jgi:hypothetical protein
MTQPEQATASPDSQPADTRTSRERWKLWRMRLQIIILGVGLGLAARYVKGYWSRANAPAPPAATQSSQDSPK